ncbi:TRAP transporter small permease [Chloroflexota bacterium]
MRKESAAGGDNNFDYHHQPDSFMRIAKLIQNFNRYLYYIGAFPLAITTVVTVTDVSGRYFGHPLFGAMEIGQFCLVIVIAFSLAHTQAKKGQIDIDLFFNLLPSRVRTVTKIVTTFLALGVMSIMAWGAIPWIQAAVARREWTDTLRWSVWPFKIVLFVGIFCLCLQLILDLIDYSRELSGRQTPIKTGDVSPEGLVKTGNSVMYLD